VSHSLTIPSQPPQQPPAQQPTAHSLKTRHARTQKELQLVNQRQVEQLLGKSQQSALTSPSATDCVDSAPTAPASQSAPALSPQLPTTTGMVDSHITTASSSGSRTGTAAFTNHSIAPACSTAPACSPVSLVTTTATTASTMASVGTPRGVRTLHPAPPFISPTSPTQLSLAATKHFLDAAITASLPTPRQPSLRFEISEDAAAHNLAILKAHNYDLQSALAAEKGTPLQPGSEFKPVSVLCPLLCTHPLWPKVAFYFTHGADFALENLSEDERVRHNILLAARGNHKGATVNADYMWQILQAEVSKGWLLVLPLDSHQIIPGALLGPVGLVFQNSIDEVGNPITKERPTHDLSFNPIPDVVTSLNARVQGDDLTPCKYGYALVRFIHYILWLRRHEPSMPIFLTKSDWKAAYRRIHTHPHIATQMVIRWEGHEYIALRMTFGGSPFPNIWNDLAESATDLANDLLRSNLPDSQFFTSILDKLPADPVADEGDAPFAPACEMADIISFSDTLPSCDVFIDDDFCAFLLRDWLRGRAILPFIIELLGRPLSVNEPMTRDPCLSLTKFLAEATPEEKKVILGWLLNTRSLMVSLPSNKVSGWSTSIRDLLSSGKATANELDTLIGRLNHLGFVVPGCWHFLGNLRHLLQKAQARPHASVNIRGMPRQDLELFLDFIKYAGEGISMNLLSTRHPTKWWRSDACEHGIGGYNVLTGRAWRWEIPEHLRFRASINCLEFIGCYTNFALAVLDGDLTPEDILLLETDSSSAEGWMRKTNASILERPLLMKIARALARLLISSKTALAPDWLAGSLNDVSDCLSRDTHLSVSQLSSMLFAHVPEQLTTDFNINPLPPMIVSQLCSWLEQETPTKESNYQPKRSDHATGNCGCASSSTSSSTMTHSLTTSPPGAAHALVSPSHARIGLVSLQLKERIRVPSKSQGTRSVPHWETWQRPLGLTTVPIPSSTRTANGTSFYNNNAEPTRSSIPKPNNRKPSPPESSDGPSNLPPPSASNTRQT